MTRTRTTMTPCGQRPGKRKPQKKHDQHRALLNLEPLENRCVPSTLTVDGSQKFQTLDGFGTNLSSEAWNNGAITPSLDILLSHGYHIFRVIVEPVQGWEDTNPNTGQYSNSNPNWAFYNNLYGTSTKFTNLWNTIRYLNDHGATVWVNLQSDAPAWMTDTGGAPATIGQDHEADWATMISTMMNYAVNTAHVHIDALGPMNEPDNINDSVQGPLVDATQYVRMMDTLESQLQQYNLGNIPLIGPDCAGSGNATSSYVPAMLADSFLMPHVMQFGFHTYQSSVSVPAITNNPTYPGRHILSDEYDGNYYSEDQGQRATDAQLWTQADQSFSNLIQIVSAGENGAIIWDGVDNFYLYYQQWSAHGLISYDWTAPDPTAQSNYGTTPRLYANAQMFQFVAPGSVLIGSSDNSSSLIQLAFQNPDGRITIVGENTGSSSQSITGTLSGGLTASLFNLYFTNSGLNEQQQADVAVTSNSFGFAVPADTIFTLTTPTAPSILGVSPISGLTSGGQSVTITGSHFSGATGVSFGGVAASSIVINSDTKITAVTPTHVASTVNVTVSSPSGTSASSPADQFQYAAVNGTAPPTVATPANATLASNQTSASLSVIGASQYGQSLLTYNWITTGTPPAPVNFSNNGNNSSSTVTASFSHAGSYSFQVTMSDPAGNTAASNTSVTVNQVATTLTVSPVSGSVTPGNSLQFSATATDQFGLAFTATPVTWSVNGGGTIDSTGKFTAGSATGGPFTVKASVGGLSSTASVLIANSINIAPTGTAYRWFGLSTATSSSNQTSTPALIDNNLLTNVTLTGSTDDVANAYEAAGVIWSTTQSIGKVTFTNGSFNASSYDGVFDRNFGLQTTTNGTTWTNVTGWSVSPAYQYNLAAAAGLTYSFSGSALSVRGFRVIGQVHSLSGNDSWYCNATEVQAFSTTASTAPTVTSVNPSNGSLAGGSSITINGSNFTGVTAVSFGTVAASSFTVSSATQIIAVNPAALAPGSVDVTVTAAYGQSPTSTADQFNYVAAPSITTQPASLTVNAGLVASFTVSATGAGNLTYQWQKLISSTWTNITSATASTYTIAATAASDAGSYRALVANVGGSTISNIATLTVNIPAPATPKGLAATPGNQQVSLSWSPSTGATTYRIYRGTAPNAETLFASPTGTSTTYVDSAATNGTTYYYQVTAANVSGESLRSAEVSATPQAQAANLALTGTAYRWFGLSTATSSSNQTSTPALIDNNLLTNVTLTGSTDDVANAYEAAGVIWSTTQSIGKVTFTNGSFNASSYDGVFDRNFGLQTTTNGTTWTNVTGWSVSPAYQYNLAAAAGLTYTFTGPARSVRGFRVIGQVHSLSGNDSWYGSATEVQAFSSAPAGLTAIAGNHQVALSWLPSSGATGYQIYRGTSSNHETLFARTTSTRPSYLDSKATNGKTYYYKVSAVIVRGETPRSAEASATPQAPAANLALTGTGYRWFGLDNATASNHQSLAPAINDSNHLHNIVLTGKASDVANAYEATGVIWSIAQSISKVTFTNGSFNTSSFSGVFDQKFGLQTTTDGTTWTTVANWSVSPAYRYNLAAAAGITYSFTGPARSVRGFRIIGQVHSFNGKDSWYGSATEVQAFSMTP